MTDVEAAAPPGGQAIAVVVPTLDEEETVGRCLASIGSGNAAEIVVSDGGSTDRTLAEVSRRTGVRIVQGAAGRGQQLNRGARATSAPILLFLHADCRLPRGWDDATRLALADPRVALSCFRLHTEPAAGDVGWASRAWVRLLDLRSYGFGLPYGDQAFALRRHTFEQLGGFPDIPLMEDLEMARRCRRHGRLRRLPLEVRTIARRFAARPVRARLMTMAFPSLFRLGVSPRLLWRWYGRGR